ncbi:MAG: imidazoleglycerol-phosphate dehydratase HisB [Desulfobacteraceae bacterium]|nr:imidazoleglycerol-phosphate dehydratase HisB [Desulfobacteraceae bacterium]
MKRNTNFQRITSETDIKGILNLDGSGKRTIDTGIGFLNHMLELWTFHAGFDLELICKGDLDVCPHHSIEDIAIALGQAFEKSMGDRKGIQRYATCYLPMDETLSRTVVDISGRPVHIFNCHFNTHAVGKFPTEMVSHFFYSFTMNAGITLHQEILYGNNDHHKVESLFKGLSRALTDAIICKNGDKDVPSTKGLL